MDLKIEIPIHPIHYNHKSSTICSPPRASKVEICNPHNFDKNYHFFDWGMDIKYDNQYDEKNEKDINDLYKEVEDFIYLIDNKDDKHKKIYKWNFQDNTRILIKKVLIDNDIKRLYILSKNYGLWLRSHIDILQSDNEYKYYNIEWK